MKEQFFNTRCSYTCMRISFSESSVFTPVWLRHICNCHIKMDRCSKQLQLLPEVVEMVVDETLTLEKIYEDLFDVKNWNLDSGTYTLFTT